MYRTPAFSTLAFMVQLISTIPLYHLTAEESYQPEKESAVSELWRWRELDDLKTIDTFYGTVDHQNRLWLPNYDGANVYDGMQITNYPYPKSFSSSFPNGIHACKNGDVYISTENGLRRLTNGVWEMVHDYDQVMDLRIVKFAELEDGRVYARSPAGLLEIKDGNAKIIPNTPERIIDIVHFRGSLWFSNANDNRIYRIPFDANGFLDLQNLQTYSITEKASHRTVLLASSQYGLIAGNTSLDCGLLQYNPEHDKWEEFPETPAPSQNHDILIESSDGTLVIHTTNSLILYHKGRWSSITDGVKIPKIFPFLITTSDELIVGGFREPIMLIDTSDKRWSYYPTLSFQCQDRLKRSWFINDNRRVVVHNPGKDQWTQFGIEDGVIDKPLRIYCSDNNLKWVLGSHQNTAAISIYNDGQWTTHLHPKLGTIIDRQSVFETDEGEIIFGSGDVRRVRKEDKGGIVTYQLANGDYQFKYLLPPEVPNRIISLVKKDDIYWFGGQKLYRYTQGKLEKAFEEDVSDTKNLWIDNLILTEKGNIWCSQRGNGLIRFSENHWEHFRENSGIISDNILSISAVPHTEVDDLYAVTDEGLVYFDGATWSPRIVQLPFSTNRSNISSRVMKDRSVWIDHDAPLFSTSADEFDAPLQETASIRWRPQTLSPDTHIHTNPDKFVQPANLIIEWSAKTPWSHTPTKDMMFSYRINNGKWSNFTTDKQKVFLNLTADNYVLEVRSRDLDGNIDSTPATVSFLVVLPMWQQPWFIVTVLAILLIVIALIVFIIRQRIRHIIALEEFKIQFFTNLSHELRTPLTVILGPLESLMKNPSDNSVQEKANIAHRSALKMQKLVDQLLEFRKIETTQTPEKITKGNLVSLISEEIDLIKSWIEEKDQSIEFHTPVESITVSTDFEKMRMILDNLISNASKYTPVGGKIQVKLKFDQKNRVILLSVSDDGSGIPQKELKNIFKPFYRAETEQYASGTGIGLSLVYALVKSMNGSITVDSLTKGPNRGTTFSLRVPESEEPASSSNEVPNTQTNELLIEDLSTDNLLLLVEDSEEIRDFLKSELQNDFKIEEAENGKIALNKAQSLIPDLILTDVMMPEMDGKELCQQLKKSELCAHIPVIILTALGSKQQQLSALETGADDFITKPVDIDILRKKLQNQMQLRDALQKKFRSRNVVQIQSNSESTELSANDRFLLRIQQMIEDEIDNLEFDLDTFAQKLSMSKMTLHRKIKAVTGASPAAYIRNVRLEEAAKLLKSGNYNVSEVIHLVGFQDHSHFGSLFKKKFGVPPSEYT
ncbi:MAG: response regulator [Opitutales bacterium]|nr:response regulator [Opitutales bacterium]